jgi:hypothetical protein
MASLISAVCALLPATSLTPEAAHNIIRNIVTAQSEQPGADGWSAYRDVLLSAEVQDLVLLRLGAGGGGRGGGGGNDAGMSSQPPKKRKADSDADQNEAAITCEFCCFDIPQISLRIACLDGTALEVTVPERGKVREAKRVIGQVWIVGIYHRTRDRTHICYALYPGMRDGPGHDGSMYHRHRGLFG